MQFLSVGRLSTALRVLHSTVESLILMIRLEVVKLLTIAQSTLKVSVIGRASPLPTCQMKCVSPHWLCWVVTLLPPPPPAQSPALVSPVQVSLRRHCGSSADSRRSLPVAPSAHANRGLAICFAQPPRSSLRPEAPEEVARGGAVEETAG